MVYYQRLTTCQTVVIILCYTGELHFADAFIPHYALCVCESVSVFPRLMKDAPFNINSLSGFQLRKAAFYCNNIPTKGKIKYQ